MRKKWYLNTWVINLFFALSFLGIAVPIFLIFPILGIVFTILQYNHDKKLFDKYGLIDELDSKIKNLSEEYTQKNENLKNDYSNKNQDLENLYKIKLATLETEYSSLNDKYNTLNNEYNDLCANVILKHYDLSDYDGLTSEECKNKITLIKMQEKELIKSNDAVIVYSNANKSVINNNLKQILRCFNTECDNILMNLSVKNIDNMRGKISKSFESINKIFKVDGLELDKTLLELKLEELNLVYT
ncbi:DUF4041 domain-containing protein, partial [Clostridium butyricum]